MSNPNSISRGRRATPDEIAAFRDRMKEGVRHNSEVAKHLFSIEELRPDIAGIDWLSFVAEVAADGTVTQPETKNLPGAYYAELFGVRGFMQEPGSGNQLPPLIDFTVKDVEKTSNLFSSALEMAYLINPVTGGGETLVFPRGLYVFDPGGRVKLTFSVNSDSTNTQYDYATQAGKAKRWGVQLLFNLFAA